MRPRGASPGFTLIEVLVVVAIAGILIAVAALNLFPDDRQVAQREASDIALAVEHARDAAWFGGRPMAVSLAEGRLREWRLATDAWSASGGERMLPGDLRVTALHVDGQPIDPASRIVFLPDGLGAPFRIALDIRGQPWGIEGDAAGAVRIQAP